VVLVEPRDAVARAERLAHAPARLRQGRDREAVALVRQVREVHRLGDETAADDADAQRQASTPSATFPRVSSYSSTSRSSSCGGTSTCTARPTRSSVRGQSVAAAPAAASASSTGRQNG